MSENLSKRSPRSLKSLCKFRFCKAKAQEFPKPHELQKSVKVKPAKPRAKNLS